MSGVYIPGMEMPTSCGFCLFEKHTDDGYECCINRCLTEYQKRPDDCPLVNIPDHGRLIDADALDGIMVEQSCEEYNHHHAPRTWERALSCFRDYIKDAPTIIPADPAEEDE